MKSETIKFCALLFILALICGLNVLGTHAYSNLTKNFAVKSYCFPLPIFEYEIHYLDRDYDQLYFFRRWEPFESVRLTTNAVSAIFVDMLIEIIILFFSCIIYKQRFMRAGGTQRR